MMRLGVVSNSLSTRNRFGLAAVRELLSRHPTIPHFEVAGLSEVPRAVARLAEQRVDTVVVNGGDGTTVTLVTELCNGSPFPYMPGLIVLAGGNTNLIASDVGIPGPPVRALNRVLSAIGRGAPLSRAKRHLIRLEQEGEPARFGFFFGAVGIVRATALARGSVHPLGLKHGLANAAALGLGAFQVLFGRGRGSEELFGATRFALGCDDEPMSYQECALMMATTLDRLLFGTQPYWGHEPGAIHVTAVRAPIDRPFRSLVPMLRGRPNSRMLENGYFSRNANRVRLAFEGSFVLDGQDYQARRTRPIQLSEGGRALFLSC